jgi:hypothetical protein
MEATSGNNFESGSCPTNVNWNASGFAYKGKKCNWPQVEVFRVERFSVRGVGREVTRGAKIGNGRETAGGWSLVCSDWLDDESNRNENAPGDMQLSTATCATVAWLVVYTCLRVAQRLAGSPLHEHTMHPRWI